MNVDREQLLDELARCFVRAALTRLLDESGRDFDHPAGVQSAKTRRPPGKVADAEDRTQRDHPTPARDVASMCALPDAVHPRET
jgi:hypothetical protein